MADSKIIERIERETGISGLLPLLAEKINSSDLQSLLLEVYRQRAQRQSPAAILADYESNRFTRPASISPVDLLDWEHCAFRMLGSDFQPITLSPVAPLGTSSAIALVDQNRVLTTIRNTEVVSDSTNVLALEAASQRRRFLKQNPKSKEQVHLTTAHRLLRTQNYGNPKAQSHFAIFSLCSAGQDEGGLRFELSAAYMHINAYLRALRTYLGGAVRLRVSIDSFVPETQKALIEQHLFNALNELFAMFKYSDFANMECVMDSSATGHDYYEGFRFHIHAGGSDGRMFELADGGPVNWTQKLLSNAKERCVISGIGSERVCQIYNETRG
jgi:hypothetical protein